MAKKTESDALAMRDAPQWPVLSQAYQSLIIRLGTTEVSLSNIMHWSEGSLIELDKVSGEAVDIYVKDQLCFRGEVVTIAENFGVRITEVVDE